MFNSLTFTVTSSWVCTSPLAVMTVVGLYDFVNVSIPAKFKSFLLIICIDVPESTTNSRSSNLKIWCRQATCFSEGEKNAALLFSLNFRTPLASLHAVSRAPRSCHSVSSWNRSSNLGSIGATLMRITLGKSFRTKDFGLECQRDVQRLSWILHVGLVSVCLSSFVKSMKTSAAPSSGLRNPMVVCLV